jgi:hypothetical protein
MDETENPSKLEQENRLSFGKCVLFEMLEDGQGSGTQLSRPVFAWNRVKSIRFIPERLNNSALGLRAV